VKTVIDVAVPLLTFLMLATVGLGLEAADFARLRRQRAVVLTGLLLPLVVLPILAVVLIRVFDPPLAVAGGLLLVAACPIGGISNFYSALARASTALSVTLTGLSCLLAGVTIPVLGLVFERVLEFPLGLSAPLPLLLAQLFFILLLPVSLGMWLRHRYASWALKHRDGIQRASLAAIAVLLSLVVVIDPGRFAVDSLSIVPLAVVFVVLSFVLGWASGIVIGAADPDRFTLAAEFATRNVAIAVAIAVTLLQRTEFATFATIYLLTETPLLMLAVWGYRSRIGARAAA
jgi:BASS family bile acid:Na+ symporter